MMTRKAKKKYFAENKTANCYRKEVNDTTAKKRKKAGQHRPVEKDN